MAMTIAFATPATPAKPERPGNSIRVSLATNTGEGGVTIRWWGNGEGADLGWCLLGWLVLVTLGRMLVGELAIASLVMVIVGKRCCGEGCARNKARGDEEDYDKGDDGVRRKEQERGGRCEFKEGGITTEGKSITNFSKSQNHRNTHNLSQNLQHQDLPPYSIAVSPAQPFTNKKTFATTNTAMPESTTSMIANLAQILAVQCPLPGQPGAPVFDGRNISVFIRNWERFTGKYSFSVGRKISDLPDYCDVSIAAYVETLVKIAKAEASPTVPTATPSDATNATATTGNAIVDDEALWKALRKLLLVKFRKADSEQHRMAVPFLRALVKDKAFRTDSEDIERYIYQFKEISGTLVSDGMLTRFDQVVLFLQGLPESVVARIYTIAKLDVDDPSSFVKPGCFGEAVETALTMNRTTTGIDRLQTLGMDHRETPVETVRQILVREKPNNDTVKAPSTSTNPPPAEATLWEERMAGIEKGLQELKIFQQTAANTAANLPATGSGYRSINSSAPRGRLYHPLPGRNTGNVMAGANQPEAGGVMTAPVTYRGCRWCGVDGHLKYQCADYGKSLSERIVHFIDQADQKTRMGPMGAGGVVVPLPESSGLWQKEWVERERKRTESQMVGGTGTEGNMGSSAVVRQLTVADVKDVAEEGCLSPGVSTLTLQPGQVCELVAVVDEHGDAQGWVETKRAADEMGDTITLDPSSRLRKRQATETTYPHAGASQRNNAPRPRPTVAFTNDDDEEIPDAGDDSETEETPETLGPETSDEAYTAPQEKKKKRANTVGATQGPRRVPVKLRAEAEPEKMVDKILNQTIDDITIREVLGLSPDLLREIWGIRRFPTVKASIPTTQVSEQNPITILDESEAGIRRAEATLNAVPPASRAGSREATQHLYACASPMVLGKVEDKYKVNMLIDSGSEMCVMSRVLWERMKTHLPIDTDISWSVGSANATHNKVFGVCHSVSVSIGGVEIDVPVFVLEGAAQDFILGRPWERKARAQYDNREDGSLYITISTPNSQRKAVFCAVAEQSERNRDRVRLLKGKALAQKAGN